MAKKTVTPTMLDFDTGESVNPFENKLAVIKAKLSGIDNPYVGNKRKIIDDIILALEKHEVQYDSVTDLFSGSSIVSIAMKLLGKKVISNDLLTSSYLNALVFVENNDVSLTKEEIKYLHEHDNPNKTDFVRANYQNRFTAEEALFLDNYRANIEEIALLDKTKQAVAYLRILHYILQRCYVGGRLNHGQVLADVNHRIEHARNDGFKMGFHDVTELLQFQSKIECKTYNLDASEFLSKVNKEQILLTDLLYLDTPYGGQSSDYADMYSFCEEYIYQKSVDSLEHIIEGGKKFTKGKGFEDHFSEVLSLSANYKTWAISYNNDSWANIDKIVGIVKQFRKNVEVCDFAYKYKYRKDGNEKGVEYLVIAR